MNASPARFLSQNSRAILALLIFAALYPLSRVNYLLFHALAELFSIVIAYTAAVLTWNARRYLPNGYLTFIGGASLVIASVDLLHALAFRGMGVFPRDDANLPTQLWVAARYLQSLAFLAAPVFLTRRKGVFPALAGLVALAALALASIVIWQNFPAAYVEGVGQTRFKIQSEYLIVAIFIAAAGLLWVYRARFDPEVARHLLLSLAWGAAAELTSTLYVDVYGFFNAALHFFKILAFYHLYKAIIESGFIRPFNTIFRSLKESEVALLRSRGELETLVAQRTRALAAQREMLESVLTQAGDGILVVDREMRVLFANHAARQITSRPDAPEPTFQLADFGVPQAAGLPIAAELRPAYQALRGEKVAARELHFLHPDGREFDLLVSAAPLRDAGGAVTSAVITFTDITEKRQAEQMLRNAYANLETRVAERTTELRSLNQQLATELSLRETAERALSASEARLRRLVESNIIGVMFANQAGQVTESNQAFLDMIGRDRDDLARGLVDWRRMTPPEYEEVDRRGLQEAAETGAATPYEKEFIRKDGGRVAVLLGYATLEEAPGHYICFALDLSAQKRDADAIRRYAAELERSNRELQEFAYVASHDLQEPLRKIIAFGDRIAEAAGQRLEERERDYLERMQRAAERMRGMINDLLELSRVSTRAQPFARVDLNEIAREVVSDLEVRLERGGGYVALDPLPTIEADPLQMRRLIQNLLSNALKFTRPGVPPEVRVFSQPGPGDNGGASVLLLVEDNGIGFDARHTERLFQPFQRLHGMGEYEGSGMGLAICQKIVQRHKGKITAYSQPGHGSTFAVTLPVRQPGE